MRFLCAGLHDHIHDVVGGIVFVGDQGYPGHFSDTNVSLSRMMRDIPILK